MNEPNIPNPNRNAVRFVVQIGRRRIICMSTSGLADRASTITQAAAQAAASANRPSTCGDVQPPDGAWLTPTSSETSHAVSSAAPAQLIRPGAVIGDSGIATSV